MISLKMCFADLRSPRNSNVNVASTCVELEVGDHDRKSSEPILYRDWTYSGHFQRFKVWIREVQSFSAARCVSHKVERHKSHQVLCLAERQLRIRLIETYGGSEYSFSVSRNSKTFNQPLTAWQATCSDVSGCEFSSIWSFAHRPYPP